MNINNLDKYLVEDNNPFTSNVLGSQDTDTMKTISDLKIARKTALDAEVKRLQELKKKKMGSNIANKANKAAVQVSQDRINDLRHSFINSSYEYTEEELIEAASFIKHLITNADISKEEAETIWKKAKKAFKENPKYKDKSKDDKYKIISGIAKRMAGINEDGDGGYVGMISTAVPTDGGAGSAMNTSTSIGGKFYAPIMPIQSHQEDFSQKGGMSKKKRKKRKLKKESMVDYIDSLFNE